MWQAFDDRRTSISARAPLSITPPSPSLFTTPTTPLSRANVCERKVWFHFRSFLLNIDSTSSELAFFFPRATCVGTINPGDGLLVGCAASPWAPAAPLPDSIRFPAYTFVASNECVVSGRM